MQFKNDAMFPTTIVDVRKTDSRLKSKRNTSLDGINKEINNCCSSVLEPYMVELFNNCLNEKKFPDEMKMAKTVPFFNKGDKRRPEKNGARGSQTASAKFPNQLSANKWHFFHTKRPLFGKPKRFVKKLFLLQRYHWNYRAHTRTIRQKM